MSAEETVTGRKRKAEGVVGSLVTDIKRQLTKLNLAVFGNKSVLSAKLLHAQNLEQLTESKASEDMWTSLEIEQFTAFLPQNVADWNPADTKFVYEHINTRTCGSDAVTEHSTFLQELRTYYHANFTVVPRVKDQSVTADALMPLMTKLGKKKPSVWSAKDINQLIEQYSTIHTINGAESSAAATTQYCAFLSQLQEFYLIRPDLKLVIDPEVVIFDITTADQATYNTELTAYLAAPVAGIAPIVPAHLGGVPGKWNPCALGLVFPMGSIAAANHFIAHMRARVPNLRATLIPGVAGAALIY